MRSISAGLVSWIESDVASVTALGRHAVDISRIPMNNILPSVTVNRIGGDPFQTLGADHGSLRQEEFEIRAWAHTGDAANAIIEDIGETLEDFEGNMGSDRKCVAVIFGGMPTLDVEETEFGPFHVAILPVTIQHLPQ